MRFSPDDVTNKNIQVQVWFADFLSCDWETSLAVVVLYKTYRVSTDVIRLLSLSSSHWAAQIYQQKSPSSLSPNEGTRRQDGSRNGEKAPTSLNGSPFWPTKEAERNDQLDRPATEGYFGDQNEFRKATNVFQYFKDNKFTGDISQSIELVIRYYSLCARQHNLTSKQKADFFFNVLADPARTFYFNNARHNMMFVQIASMTVKEYNCDVRQLQAQVMLQTLRMGKYMSGNDVTSQSEG